MVNGNINGFQVELTSKELELINKIHLVREKGNFQTVRKTIGENAIKSLLTKLYPANDIKTMEKVLGVSDSSISNWFKSLGIPSVRRHMSNKVFPANFDASFVLPFDKTSINYLAIKMDVDLAYLIGFSLGDGAMEKYSLEVFNRDLGMQTYLESIMKKYGAVNKSVDPNGFWKLRLSSLKIANLAKQNKKVNNETMDFIFSDDLLAQKFLAGFWDAEGSVLKQDNYFHIYLYNSNKDLIERIQNYLELR